MRFAFTVPCQMCGRSFLVSVATETLEQLKAAGVEPEEAGEAVVDGLLRGSLLCDDCREATLN